MRKAEQIICPAPMLENPVDANLARLLVPAPHVVPEKKAKKEATGARKSSRFQVSDDSGADSSPRKRGGERGLSPRGGREEEEGFPNREGRRVQEGKDYSPRQLRQHQRWRGRMAFKGQASGEIVSIRIPE